MAFIYFNTCGQDYDNSTLTHEWDTVVGAGGGVTVNVDATYGYVVNAKNNFGAAQCFKSLTCPTAGIANFTAQFPISEGSNLQFAGMYCFKNITNQLVISSAATGTGTVFLTTSPLINPSNYHCFEFKWDNVAGTLLVREDGNVIGIASGLTLPTVGNNNFGLFSNGTAGINIAVMAIQDLTGPAPWNNLVGEVKPFVLFPSAAGIDTDWANSFSANNYAQVNARIAPGDTSYLSSDTVGNIDLYQTGTLPLDAISVAAVMGKIDAKKFVGGTRFVGFAIYNGSSTDISAGQGIGSGSYTEYEYLYAENPFSSANWTLADFTNIQFGMKVTA